MRHKFQEYPKRKSPRQGGAAIAGPGQQSGGAAVTDPSQQSAMGRPSLAPPVVRSNAVADRAGYAKGDLMMRSITSSGQSHVSTTYYGTTY
mmetsp:Transcript_3112/g.6695  ORF Transcript_3112/g.6695 Transcript_3112/m.6695 type:complete len:91 (-) Transcript_3112:666-938(-)